MNLRLFKFNSTIVCCLGALSLALAVGCSSTSSQKPLPAPTGQEAPGQPLLSTNSIDIIRIGDKLTVNLTDIPNPYINLQVDVRDDGTISLPLNVTIKAAGKRKADLEAEIRDQYVPRLFKRLDVSVKTEDRLFYVGGYVKAPNRYIYSGELTVLKAIKIAGDFTEYARRTQVTVTRSDGTKITVDCKKAEKDARLDIPIYPGDKVEVPKKTLPWE
jgi:polysaccharide export outer membrane protein